MRSALGLAFALVVLLGRPPSAQSVRVVDIAGGPGSEFTSLAAAVSSAAEGDLLLVRGGDYPETLLQGMGACQTGLDDH